VFAVSSARMNEGWLSEDACRDGTSTGNPFMLARLIGLEKLNAGRGSRVPPTDISELIDGDRVEYMVGDVGEFENPLPVDNFRCGDMAGGGFRELKSSSEPSMDIDRGLGVRWLYGERGGANALES
jgi:hypothetical protein